MNLNQRRLRARSLLLTLVMLAALSPAAVLPAGAAASAMWNEGEDVTITDNTNYGSVTVFGSGNAVILTIPSVMTVLKADSIELNGSPLTFDGIGTLNVTGNIFNGSPSYYGMTMHGGMMTVGGSINLENNCFTLNGGTLSVTGSMGDVELCGGTLTAGSYSGKVFAPGPYLISDGDGYSVIAVDEYGYMTDVADAGEKTLTPAVASVTEGGTPHYYPTLQSAVDAAAGAGSAEAPGMVTLLYDVLLSDPLTVGAGCSVTLDLNGHAVDRGLTGRRSEEAGCVVRVSGSLEITDSSAKNADKTDGKGKITGGSNGDFDGGGVCVCGNGSFTLSGGSVIGNAASHGGGVFVGENGSFMMTGGSITGNSAVYGSVYVDRNGSFTLSGGSINGNSAKTGGGVYVNGNGANAGGSFTLSGGRITGNSANAGGGVHVHLGGRLFVSGSPKITGNVKYAEGTTTYENGLYTGGADDDLYLPDSETVIVVTGALTGGDRSVGVKTGFLGTFARASDENNEGETVTYELTDTDAGYFFSDAEGASVERGGSELKISTLWMALQSLLDAGGEVTLDQNFTAIEADRILVIPADKSVTLDLNGHTIDRALSGAEKTVKDGGVIKVEGSLTLTDGSEDKTGTITGGNSSAGGGVYVCMGGVLTVTGGTITGCTANSGGGVYVDGGELRMSGCAVISGNSAGSLGGGVCLCKGAAFTMEGGTIRGNGAVGNGGGVYVDAVMGRSEFTMTGGTVSGNSVPTYSDSHGGGVYVGCEYIFVAAFHVRGGATVRDNYKDLTYDEESGAYVKGGSGAADNVYLGKYDDEWAKITVTDKLTGGVGALGVTLADGYAGAFTSGLASGGEKAFTCFASDAEGYAVGRNADGEAIVAAARTVTFRDGETTLFTRDVADGTAAVRPDAPTKAGCVFTGWTLNGEPYDFTAAVTRDITLTAAWAEYSVADGAVTAPKGAVLILATYDGGRLATVTCATLGEDCVGADAGALLGMTALPAPYRLMLVDGGTFAPLCAAAGDGS